MLGQQRALQTAFERVHGVSPTDAVVRQQRERERTDEGILRAAIAWSTREYERELQERRSREQQEQDELDLALRLSLEEFGMRDDVMAYSCVIWRDGMR